MESLVSGDNELCATGGETAELCLDDAAPVLPADEVASETASEEDDETDQSPLASNGEHGEIVLSSDESADGSPPEKRMKPDDNTEIVLD